MTSVVLKTPECSDQDPDSDQAPTSGNMEIWDKLRRVNPTHTKPFQREGGFRGTAVKPAWQECMMTEIFGPVGFGWGMTKPEYEIVHAGKDILVYCTVGVWFTMGGVRSDIFWGEGGDKILKTKANGDVVTDDEGRKKSFTDALGNAYKRIGMAADIHMGLWDDSKYRDDNDKFFVVKSNPELHPPAIVKFEADLKAKLDAVTDLDTLDDLWRGGINARIREIGGIDKAAQNRMISAFSQKKNEIVKKLEASEAPAKAGKPAPDPINPSPGPETAEKPEAIQNAPGEADEDRNLREEIPSPRVIDIPLSPDGKRDWKAWGAEAKKQIIEAGNGLYGHDWVNDWLGVNAENLALMREHNSKWADAVSGKVTQVLDHYLVKEEEARAEASKEFPTIAVQYDGENPDWPRFVRDIRRYIGKSPNCLVAAAWWSRHTSIVGNLSKAGKINAKGTTGETAAAALKTELVSKFPQLANTIK